MYVKAEQSENSATRGGLSSICPRPLFLKAAASLMFNTAAHRPPRSPLLICPSPYSSHQCLLGVANTFCFTTRSHGWVFRLFKQNHLLLLFLLFFSIRVTLDPPSLSEPSSDCVYYENHRGWSPTVAPPPPPELSVLSRISENRAMQLYRTDSSWYDGSLVRGRLPHL